MKELIELYVEKMWRVTDKEGYICDSKAEQLLIDFVKDIAMNIDIVLSFNEDDIDRGVGHCTYVRKLLEEELKVK